MAIQGILSSLRSTLSAIQQLPGNQSYFFTGIVIGQLPAIHYLKSSNPETKVQKYAPSFISLFVVASTCVAFKLGRKHTLKITSTWGTISAFILLPPQSSSATSFFESWGWLT